MNSCWRLYAFEFYYNDHIAIISINHSQRKRSQTGVALEEDPKPTEVIAVDGLLLVDPGGSLVWISTQSPLDCRCSYFGRIFGWAGVFVRRISLENSDMPCARAATPLTWAPFGELL